MYPFSNVVLPSKVCVTLSSLHYQNVSYVELVFFRPSPLPHVASVSLLHGPLIGLIVPNNERNNKLTWLEFFGESYDTFFT